MFIFAARLTDVLRTVSFKMEKLRSIASRSYGQQNGPITCLIEPEGNGDRLKPFVFLDFLAGDVAPGFGFPMHPHSGIATLTWQLGCDVDYKDSTGNKFLMEAGGVEWMLSGRGAWHQAKLLGGTLSGFVLWVALPRELEDGPALGRYIPPDKVPVVSIPGGEIKVLLGALDVPPQTAESSLDPHQDMNYFVVSLDKRASWIYRSPANHNVVFAFGFEGNPTIQGEPSSKTLLEFSDESGAIEFASPGKSARILIGSARKHNFPLVLGDSSVHTNDSSLIAAMEYLHANETIVLKENG